MTIDFCASCRSSPCACPVTPLADEAEALAAGIKRHGDALEAIQAAIDNRGAPDTYAATLTQIRDIIHTWEDNDGR